MAICNFRADAFGFASGETIDLKKVVEVLEKAGEEGIEKKDLDPEWHAFFTSLKNKGLVSERTGRYCLRKKGRDLLNACHALMRQSRG